MTKGRGSNHRRRNSRQKRAVGCYDANGGASHCVGPDNRHRHFVGRMRWTPPTPVSPSMRRSWWRRMWERAVELVTGSRAGYARRVIAEERQRSMVRRERAEAIIDQKAARAVTRVRQKR